MTEELLDNKGSDHTETSQEAPPTNETEEEPEEYVYEQGKVTIKFLFANRDGLSAFVKCNESDTVATVKASLLSVWPKELDSCTEGERIRLICMGRGILSPDNLTLEQCNVPVFRTHPTPVNVSVKPVMFIDTGSPGGRKSNSGGNGAHVADNSSCCVIL